MPEEPFPASMRRRRNRPSPPATGMASTAVRLGGLLRHALPSLGWADGSGLPARLAVAGGERGPRRVARGVGVLQVRRRDGFQASGGTRYEGRQPRVSLRWLRSSLAQLAGAELAEPFPAHDLLP